MLPWQPEFQSNQPKTPMQPFPLPGYDLHEILLKFANWLKRYTSLKVWTEDGCKTIAILISHLSLWLRWEKNANNNYYWHFNIYDEFTWDKHEKSFITLRPGCMDFSSERTFFTMIFKNQLTMTFDIENSTLNNDHKACSQSSAPPSPWQ